MNVCNTTLTLLPKNRNILDIPELALTKHKRYVIVKEVAYSSVLLAGQQAMKEKNCMDGLEKLHSIGRDLFVPLQDDLTLSPSEMVRHIRVYRNEIVASALKALWQELGLGDEPLIFDSPAHGSVYSEHHPMLLDQLVERGKRRKHARFGQIVSWRRLEAPLDAHGIAQVQARTVLLKPDMLHNAEVDARRTRPGAPYGWLCYTFASGWSALSAHFFDDNDDERGPMVMTIVPHGRQDEWLAFVALLDELRDAITRRERRGGIEIVGGNDDLIDVIKRTSFDDVVLTAETLELVTAQRRIFSPEILRHYAALHVPRLRKVLLIGPPGTGKTTLLKAEGARHVKQGGLVFYVCAPPKGRGSSWQQLSYAIQNAAESKLPSLILVEDFEMFVSDGHELQLVLNVLDGIATPDNPAGTLLLATSNDPESIDPRIRDRPGRVDILIEIGLVEDEELGLRFLKRFLGAAYREEEHAKIAPELLKQPGSHFREVCIAGSIRALEEGRATVLYEDLLWAHEAILKGRALAAEAERFMPPSTKKRGNFFGKEKGR
jgi:AAA+ superfamily predicted ATPase